MNKTVNANIAGLVFYIEESAYDLLQNYLKNIEANFSNADERIEIMRDVEARIAELFQERNANRKEVVNLEDVKEVIAIMGEPEDYQSDEFEGAEEQTASHENSTEQESYTTEKKLYRDEENAVIGGVCSGLAAYFGIDPVIIRIIFVMLVLFGLSGVFIYIILFFITPEAKTAADKLRMRGAPINVESIKQTAQEFKESVKDAAQRNNFGKKMSKTIERGVQSSSKFARGIAKFVGFGLLVGGLFALLILISVFIGDGGLISFWGDRHMMNVGEFMDVFYTSDFQSNLAYFSLLLVLFIPIIGMIYTGIKLLFDIKGTIKIVAISGTVLWVLAVGVIAITSIPVGLEFTENATVTESIEVSAGVSEITINVEDDDVFSNNIVYGEYWKSTNLMDVQEEYIYLGYPRLKIVESSKDSTFKVIVQKEAHGLNYKEAILNAESIEYDVTVVGNVLNLDPYMIIPKEGNFRAQDVEVIVRVPEGYSVKLGENIERVLVPISERNRESKERKSFENTTWKNDNDKMIFIDQ